MKLAKTAKALAIAVAVGMSSQVMAATTNQWWNLNFDSVADIIALTNETTYTGIGVWTTAEGDESSIAADVPGGKATKAIKLDTQGNNLTWTPTSPSDSPVVLVDADIYLVGSDTAPTGFDEDSGKPVQTAIYLKNEVNEEGDTTNSVLCAYVSLGEGENGWVELSGYTMIDTNWYNIKIEVTYPAEANPVVSYKVKGYLMSSEAVSSFDIANVDDFTASIKKNVSSVSFRGTGAVDNFIASKITPESASTLNFAVDTYASHTNTNPDSTDNVYLGGDASAVTPGDLWFVLFNDYSIVGDVTNYLALVRVYTNATDYVDYAVSESEGILTPSAPLTLDDDWNNVRYEVDTTLLTAGYAVEAYYGGVPAGNANPIPQDPAVIGGATEAPATAFEMLGDPAEEYFSVTFLAPEAGIQYTLCTSATLVATEFFIASDDDLAKHVSTAVNEEITLSAPTGGAPTMFYVIKASQVAQAE